MLQRYSVRLRIYSWFMKYCHPNWPLRASSLFPSGDVGRHQQSILVFLGWTNSPFSTSVTNINFCLIGDRNEVTKRKGTILTHVWDLREEKRIVVKCNHIGQPIGKECGILGQFCKHHSLKWWLLSYRCQRLEIRQEG